MHQESLELQRRSDEIVIARIVMNTQAYEDWVDLQAFRENPVLTILQMDLEKSFVNGLVRMTRSGRVYRS